MPRTINFVKVGALAALLVAPTAVAANSVGPATHEETVQNLYDIAGNEGRAIASAWLTSTLGLLIVPVFAGLYSGLRRWSEDHMRVALLFGVLSGIFIALYGVPGAVLATAIGPEWARASDETSRAALLSDAEVLLGLGTALLTISLVLWGIALITSSIVMLRLRGRWWTRLGWMGIVGGVIAVAGAPLEESGGLPIFVPLVFLLVWTLGVGVGLLRLRDRADGPQLGAGEANTIPA